MRKRMICPTIWTNRKFIRLSDKEKLLFIGIFSTADDYGKLWYDLLSLKASIFPCDNLTEEDLSAALRKLCELNLIVTDKKSIKIHGWKSHQSVPKPQNSNIPDPIHNHYSSDTEPLPKQFGNDTGTVIHGKITGSAKERKKERKKERESDISERERSIEEVRSLLNDNSSFFNKGEYESINSLIDNGQHLSAMGKIYEKIEK